MIHIPFGVEAEPQDTELPRFAPGDLPVYTDVYETHDSEATMLVPLSKANEEITLRTVPDSAVTIEYKALLQLLGASTTGRPAKKDFERHIAALSEGLQQIKSSGATPALVGKALEHQVELIGIRDDFSKAEAEKLRGVAVRIGREAVAGEYSITARTSEYGPSTAPVVAAPLVGLAVVRSSVEHAGSFYRVALEPVVAHEGQFGLLPDGLTVTPQLYTATAAASLRAV